MKPWVDVGEEAFRAEVRRAVQQEAAPVKTYGEIARELGISRPAVQSIERRALAKLRASGLFDDWRD